MEGLNTAHYCPFRLLFDHFQAINGLYFLFLLVLHFLSLVFLSFVSRLLLLLCILHDDQLLQILDLLPHVADHLILPLNLRPEIQYFPLVASLLPLNLRFEVVIDPDNALLKHTLIAIQLLAYITFEAFTKPSYHFLSFPHLLPRCCYPLLLSSEALNLLF